MTEDRTSYHLKGKRVWVAGHKGMVGAALVRALQDEGCDILTVERSEVDLKGQSEVEDWLFSAQPDAIFLAAATVGGILANQSRPVDFLYDNLMIESNVINAAHRAGVEKLLFLGSSCIYPRLAEQPMNEDALLTGPLEPTNEWYAVAKIAGIKLCQAFRRQFGNDFISAMPTNLYGPHDNFDLETSHVIPALLAKAHTAKTVGNQALDVWGTGRPRREFMHVDDAASALIFLMKNYSGDSHVNVGVGKDMTIRELAQLICQVVGFDGELRFETDRPDGTPVKRLDVSRLTALGWSPRIDIETGLKETYDWYKNACD